ncbi:hypothetical protein BJ878DRAFT_583891 [Calycina marina]|uniref:Uncharacterized protein n=1 Tax=Calycina marina TaxID=1763456 RepID=A0A9P7YYK4_9HELO|nr:hypothetical protein BJ878DRAFT_583891 [Calycina marina]
MSEVKPQFTSDYQESHDQRSEFETRGGSNAKTSGIFRMAESARLGLTVLALLTGIAILGTASDTLQVYNTTSLTTDFELSLWPQEFDLRPTVALVVCGSVIFLTSTLSLVAGKVQPIRKNVIAHSFAAFVAPTISLIAGLVATSFYYGVNTSNTVYSLQAWTCQWTSVSMNVKPHWSTLCKESKTALYLSVMIIPLEVLILASAIGGACEEKKATNARERKGSPAMS